MSEKHVLVCDRCGQESSGLTPGVPWLELHYSPASDPSSVLPNRKHFCSDECVSKYFDEAEPHVYSAGGV